MINLDDTVNSFPLEAKHHQETNSNSLSDRQKVKNFSSGNKYMQSKSSFLELQQQEFECSNQGFIKLQTFLQNLKSSNAPEMKKLRDLICSYKPSIQIRDLKNNIFCALSGAFGVRMDQETKRDLDQKLLESLLLTVFEIRLLSFNQMRSLLSFCRSFYKKTGCLFEKEDLIERLEELYSEACDFTPMTWLPLEKKLDNPSNNQLPNPQKIEKREKNDCNMQKEEEKVESITQELQNEKEPSLRTEECLICMENARETVFLPCCHFLTCQICSPKVSKCPICNHEINQKLKIYWS